MASALIAAQVTLCAVIGFVTFGVTHHRAGAPARSESLAGAPHLIPPATAAAPPAPPRHPATDFTSPAKRTDRTEPATADRTERGAAVILPPDPATEPSPPPGAGVTLVPVLPGIPSDTETAGSHEPEASTPGPSVTGVARPTGSPPVQIGVVVDALCNPLSAVGVTDEGEKVVCRLASDAKPRWLTT
jgi:hypothetical protein